MSGCASCGAIPGGYGKQPVNVSDGLFVHARNMRCPLLGDKDHDRGGAWMPLMSSGSGGTTFPAALASDAGSPFTLKELFRRGFRILPR